MKRLSIHILKVTPALMLLLSCSNPDEHTTWRVTGGTKENIRYSTLNQFDTTNVTSLKVAWVYNTGDGDTVNHSQIQCNPIIVDDIMYATTPKLNVVALNAATGQELWRFDPQQGENMNQRARFIMNNNRGVTYWEDDSTKRIFFTAGANLYSIDARSGLLVKSFGDEGAVDLHEGLDRDVKTLFVSATSPGIIFKDLLILGTRVSEGPDAAPGHIRAYDVRTGVIRWIFHTIPHPGEFGFDTWEDTTAYRNIGGANSWAGFSLDEQRGIVFAPTGSASFDFYGGRRKGANLFANSTLALDAATGKYIWHFQNIHHDVWDRDLPTAPALVRVTIDGKTVDAVAQPTKQGFVFVLDRETGKPLFPVDEVDVPTQSEMKGEQLWPTQPVPRLPKPFMRQTFTEADLNDLVPDSSYQDIRERFLASKTGLFEPMLRRGTIFYPGLDGGAEWGGPAFDPETGLLYINANEIPWLIGFRDAAYPTAKDEPMIDAGQRLYRQYCATCHGADRKGTGNFPGLIDSWQKYSAQTLDELLVSGRRMMPAMSNIPPVERKAIATFILELKSDYKKIFKYVPPPVDSFRHLPYSITGYNKFLTKEGYPAIRPPWGTLNAIDLNTGEIAWRIPFGEYPEFKAKGIITGTENYGGPVVTSNGLLFIAATRDGKLRAFNKYSGKLLWETDLPAPGFATPSMYQVDGKQYLVIACGGGKLGTKSGDAYVAFALP
jgi:quinoprotein glucose dehydrogenase